MIGALIFIAGASVLYGNLLSFCSYDYEER